MEIISVCDSRCPEKGPCLYTHSPGKLPHLNDPQPPRSAQGGHSYSSPVRGTISPSTYSPVEPSLLTRSSVCVYQSLSHVRLFATPWTAAHQAPLSMGFSRQQYWNGWPCPPPGDLPDPGIEPTSPTFGQIFYHLSHQGNPTTKEVQEIYLSSNNPKVLSLPLPYIHPSMISQVKTPTLTLHSWRFS